MRLGRRDPVHRAEVLKREREMAAELFNPPTEEERQRIARVLGREDVLTDPQQPLPLERAA